MSDSQKKAFFGKATTLMAAIEKSVPKRNNGLFGWTPDDNSRCTDANASMALAHLALGRRQDAEELIGSIIRSISTGSHYLYMDFSEEYTDSNGLLVTAFIATGRRKDAEALLKNIERSIPKSDGLFWRTPADDVRRIDSNASMALAYLALGRREDAEELLNKMENSNVLFKGPNGLFYWDSNRAYVYDNALLAILYLALGRRPDAEALLAKLDDEKIIPKGDHGLFGNTPTSNNEYTNVNALMVLAYCAFVGVDIFKLER